MVPGELVLLTVPQDSIKCFGMGLISKIDSIPWPIPNKYVLTQDEITAIQTATTAFNQKISDMAALNGLALVDMHTKMKGLQAGIIWDGIRMNARYVTGGVFSLDGIHLNPRGNAVLANYFIESINAEFGSTIPYVDITKYPGVIFP
jgi:lysophospholipase L1-like esterase